MFRLSGRSKSRKYSAGKGRSASAVLRRVRIVKNESRLHQAFLVIEREAGEIEEALWIHDYLDAFVIEHCVGRARLGFKLELITEAGTTTAEDTQAEITFDTLLFKRL